METDGGCYFRKGGREGLPNKVLLEQGSIWKSTALIMGGVLF